MQFTTLPLFAAAATTPALMRRLLWVVVAAGVIAAAWWLLRPEPETVVIQQVVRGPMNVFVRAEGATRMRERVVVYAPSGGEIGRIALRAGDAIRQGDGVVQLSAPSPALLDPRTRAELEARSLAASDALGQAQQALTQAEASLQLRRSELERAQMLVERGLGTASGLETAEFAVQAGDAQLASARFAVRVARHNQQQIAATMAIDEDAERTTVDIESPIDGVVLSVLQPNAGMVAAGTPLIEVGDPKSLEAVVNVLTADAVRLHAGARAILTRWGGDEALMGRIARIEPLAFSRMSALGVEEQRVNVVLHLDPLPDAAAQVGDGWRLEADLLAWHGDDVVQVPLNAVFRADGGWAVWTVTQNVLALSPVELGERNGRFAQILSGVSPGEAVVMHPSEVLQAGAEVAVITDRSSASRLADVYDPDEEEPGEVEAIEAPGSAPPAEE